MDEDDVTQWPHYPIISMMLFLSGRAATPEQATKLAREFFAADIPVVSDPTRNIEFELTWIMRRLRGDHQSSPDPGDCS